ncbi:trypsin-4-like [Plutella xylostella]|uniref:trypsin-4-like n=1 Tax=Plutella xylostella TaxID=51655 RepID=UPI00203303D2|nr:trypsin-4-like [Plutella xylostella]
MWAVVLLMALAWAGGARAGGDRRVITTLRHSAHHASPRAAAAEPASAGQLPYLVSLKEKTYKVDNDTLWQSVCGGVILAARRVLAPAHCFEQNKFFFVRHPDYLRVVAGDPRAVALAPDAAPAESSRARAARRLHARRAQWRRLAAVALHPHYHFPAHDLALLDVDSPFVFNEWVDYIVADRWAQDYRRCLAAGAGAAEAVGGEGASLVVANVSVASRWRCSMLWEMNMNDFVCSESVVDGAALQAAGGPLVCEAGGAGGAGGGELVLAGLLAGLACDGSPLFTRLSAHADFIDEDSLDAAPPHPATLQLLFALLVLLQIVQ